MAVMSSMRLTEFGQIALGKEEPLALESERKDIIHRVFLGDRQVWERTVFDIPAGTASFDIVTTWDIKTDFLLDRCTDVTSIVGLINWGDSDEDDWRSGNANYYHHYDTEGEYNISLNCKGFIENASIAQIKEVNHYTSGEVRNELIGVTLSLMPFSNHKLGYNNRGVFEDVLTIRRVTIPMGIEAVPDRLFFNTSFQTLNFPEQENNIIIGNNSFASNVLEEIVVNGDIEVSGKEKPLGFTTSGSPKSDIVFKCKHNTNAAAYAINTLGFSESAGNLVYLD